MISSTCGLLGTAVFIASCLYSSAVTAAPSQRRATVPGRFLLQTSLADGATDANKDGLYFSGYHTGAGTSDATLINDIAQAHTALLNGTYVQFDVGQQEFPIGLYIYFDTNYAIWDPVLMNNGPGTDDMLITDDNKLVWNNEAFAGWLACDWHHGRPQLFYKYTYLDGYIPQSCSAVELNIVAKY